MKKVNIFLILILLTACSINKQINHNPNDNENISQTDRLNNKAVEMAKNKYDNINYENGTVILISLEDMEQIYNLDISDYKKNEVGCDLKMSHVKIEIKDGNKEYKSNLNCSGLSD